MTIWIHFRFANMSLSLAREIRGRKESNAILASREITWSPLSYLQRETRCSTDTKNISAVAHAPTLLVSFKLHAFVYNLMLKETTATKIVIPLLRVDIVKKKAASHKKSSSYKNRALISLKSQTRNSKFAFTLSSSPSLFVSCLFRFCPHESFVESFFPFTSLCPFPSIFFVRILCIFFLSRIHCSAFFSSSLFFIILSLLPLLSLF